MRTIIVVSLYLLGAVLDLLYSFQYRLKNDEEITSLMKEALSLGQEKMPAFVVWILIVGGLLLVELFWPYFVVRDLIRKIKE